MSETIRHCRPDIDPLRLDEEWIVQPKMYHYYATKQADQKKLVKELKAKLQVIKAKLSRHIRKYPNKYGLARATDPSVADTILDQPPYLAAQQSIIDAEYVADILTAALDTLDQRKKALENLVDLHGRDYFATPRAGTTEGRMVRRRADAARTKYSTESEDTAE